MTPRVRSRCAVAAVVLASIGLSGCLFLPNIGEHGYLPCDKDGACPAGRYCDESVCAPPPWNDQTFGTRRAIIVDNSAALPIAAGTAIPVVVGGDAGAIALAELGADFRFADFDRANAQWRVVAVYLDRERDRFTAWIPASREIPAGGSDVLAFVESNTADDVPQVVEDPASVYGTYDAFDAPLAGWFASPAGGPIVQDGVVNVADNQAIVLQAPLIPPVLAMLVARINGAACDEVFLGLVGDDRALFEVPPEAGLFIGNNLAATAQVAPTSDSTPTNVGDGLTLGNALARTLVAIDGGGVLVKHDDAVAFANDDVRPPFGADPLYLAVQVGGACSVDVEAAWTTPIPQPFPTVVVQPPIDFNLAFEN